MMDLWLSLLAAALLTGAKQTDFPLVLLWFIAAWPAFALAKRSLPAMVPVCILGLLASVLPITLINFRYIGTWVGTLPGLNENSPFWGVIGNAFCIPLQNLMPPFSPWADRWNALMARFVTTPFGHHFACFERFGLLSLGSHSINEANAGIGLGICLLTLVSFFAARQISKKTNGLQRRGALQQRLLRNVPWLLLLVFMAKDLAYENARQLAPYYAFFLPFFLVKPGHALLVRQRWWQRVGIFLMLFTIGLLVVSRSRPLFPAQTIIHWLQAEYPNSRLITRLEFCFDTNPAATKLGREIMKNIPSDEKWIGYATVIGNAEPDLWFPFGGHSVRRITPDDNPGTLKAADIHYIVVDSSILDPSEETVEQWMGKYQGELIGKVNIQTQPYLPPYDLDIVRLQPH